jgi:two-component system sensor histidine kinase AgrC
MANFFDIIITIFLLFIAIINLNTIRFTKREVVTTVLVTSIISIPFGFYLHYISIVPIDLILIIFIYRKEKKLTISILMPLLANIISIISDYIVSCINVFVFNLHIVKYYDSGIYILSLIETIAIIVIISRWIGYLIEKKFKIFNVDFTNKFSLIIIISLTITLIVFYTNIVLGSKLGFTDEILKLNGVLFFIYCIFLGITMNILFKSVTKELELKNKQAHFESLQRYTENLENLYSEMRVFKHDYINIISSMIGYMEDNDMEGLKTHFTKNIIPLSDEIGRSNSQIDLLKNIKVPEIKGILSSKLIRAQEMGIDVKIDIVEPISNIPMGIIDIVRALGILLDNAIEGAEKCETPILRVGFIKKEDSLIVIILNSCLEDVPPIYKLNKKGFSTKGENRGVGLSNLKMILDKYQNVFLDTIIENNTFLQKVTIENN